MREELERKVGPVFWSDLRAHAARDAIIIVALSLDIVEVGLAVAENDTARVGSWLDEGLLTKPSKEQLTQWSRTSDERWDALVVKPYVLVRERANSLPPPPAR